jgi:type II secretory pathway component PulF
MTLWKYRATPLDKTPTEHARPLEGLLHASTRQEARARLRAAGLQALTIRAKASPWGTRAETTPRHTGTHPPHGAQQPTNTQADRPGHAESRSPSCHLLKLVADRAHALARARRVSRRAEAADALATLLDAGLPLHEALSTLSPTRVADPFRVHIARLREGLSGGQTFSACAAAAPGWFDPIDCAFIEAGEAAGTLSHALRCIAGRLEHHAQGRARLIGLLAYPVLVSVVALGVVVFLASHTLPELSRTLASGGIEPPLLTRVVMTFGQAVRSYWWLVPVLPAALLLALLPFATQRGHWLARRVREDAAGLSLVLTPRLMRAQALGASIRTLAELIGVGIPLAEALRITAPTAHPSLARALHEASRALEDGAPPSRAFASTIWFDSEFKRLLELAQSSGTLDTALLELTSRLERRAERAAQTLARVLEPSLIILLSGLVGLVVMAAVLPLTKLQEILP